MTTDLLLALVAFSFVSAATPGPNNVMLVASAANFGVARTLPHMAGIAGGLALMVVLIGFGLAQVFEAAPWILSALKALCALYLLYLAFRIATASKPGEGRSGRPLSALQAALFQWVNPKAWAMTLGAVTIYAPDRTAASVLAVAAVFVAVSLPSMGLWVVAGRQLSRVLSVGRRLSVFNAVMAGLLVASLVPALLL